jgi:hypothetical protein
VILKLTFKKLFLFYTMIRQENVEAKKIFELQISKKRKINIMVASTVYQNRDLLLQICGILNTYGYHVINSEYGTIYPALGMNNTDACLAAVEECDIFFGVINPMYSMGIAQLEFQRAIAINKPRRFIAYQKI